LSSAAWTWGKVNPASVVAAAIRPVFPKNWRREETCLAVSVIVETP
jgi:hypothetical protein